MRSWHEEYERRLDLSSGYVRSKPKYSQIQKEQAVKHHAEHGRCIASAVKALGYRLREHANLLPEHLRNRAALQNGNPPEIKRGPGRPRKDAAAPTSD